MEKPSLKKRTNKKQKKFPDPFPRHIVNLAVTIKTWSYMEKAERNPVLVAGWQRAAFPDSVSSSCNCSHY